jgi:hypothetical protein
MRQQIEFETRAKQAMMCKQLESAGVDLKSQQEFSVCLAKPVEATAAK